MSNLIVWWGHYYILVNRIAFQIPRSTLAANDIDHMSGKKKSDSNADKWKDILVSIRFETEKDAKL